MNNRILIAARAIMLLQKHKEAGYLPIQAQMYVTSALEAVLEIAPKDADVMAACWTIEGLAEVLKLEQDQILEYILEDATEYQC